MSSEGSINMEALTALVSQAANAAARQVSYEVREQIKEDLDAHTQAIEFAVARQIDEKMKGFMGNTDAAEHIIQHDRLNRLLGMMDKMSSNFFGKIIVNLLLFGAVLTALAMLGYKHLFGA